MSAPRSARDYTGGVRLLPLLMRLLLCLALVANGIAGAQASVRMAYAHATPARMIAAVDDTSDVPPCHRHHETAPVAAAHDEAPMPGHGDCCKDGRCDCPCAPSLLQAALAMRLPVRPGTASVQISPPTSAHRAPRLPHLIRPPIG